jgi:hypothetical protein
MSLETMLTFELPTVLTVTPKGNIPLENMKQAS